jgi:hypothetical protein
MGIRAESSGVSLGTMRSLRRVRKRRGRCYELAFRVMHEEPGAERFVLVHGVVGKRFGHAWIELDDGTVYDPVYDPVSDRCVPADEYTAMFHAVVERRYTRAEAIDKMLENGFGPWHDTAGVTN